jgi:CspA family cold shock protein
MQQKGVVKWFNKEKGYGFIKPDNGTQDVFVHMSALRDAELKELRDGQPIEFDLESRNDKTSAVNLKIVAE